MPREIINPPELHDPRPFGYSHIVSARGELVFIAGQVGIDADAQTVSDEFEGQAKRAFENLGTALKAADLDWENVVEIKTHIVDHGPEKLDVLRDLALKYWGDEAPVQTMLGVAALGAPHLLFEVDAVAVR